MYLLNDQRITDRTRRADQAGNPMRPEIRITDMHAECVQHTWYYFRLGPWLMREDPDGAGWQRDDDVARSGELVVAPGECVRIRSFEKFGLGPRVMGIFGPPTDLALEGLSLLHGPFIDPLFPSRADRIADDDCGHLELALVNHSRRAKTLTVKTRIGKIAFFDVSDTYPVRMLPDSLADQTFGQRRS